MIYELLTEGEANAKTAREISEVLNIEPRKVTMQIENERRAGRPICASCDNSNPGYYLAETKETLQRYCAALKHREREIAKTRHALIKCATALPDMKTE